MPPDVKGREGVLGVHTRDKPLEDVDLGLVAQQTSGLTGADLANICNEAAIFATRRGAKAIGMVDFDSALERVVAGVQSRRVLNEHEKRVVAYHEAGHALCGELLPSVDRVHRISIVPRGQALGYTLNLPAEDRYLKTRDELLDYMTMLLGGRMAEQVVFGAITTGASDDLKRVADISHSMVHDYAMGTAGVGRAPDGDVRLSETTLRIRDEERKDLVEEAGRAAQKIIVDHRHELDAFANELLEHEVLERESIERIMKGVPAPRAPRESACTWSPRPGRTPRRAAPGRSTCPSSRPARAAPSLPQDTTPAAPRTRAGPDGYRLRRVFTRIDHIGVAVEEIEPSLELYRDSFQLRVAHREVVQEQGVEAVLLDVGENHVELLAPLGPDTPVGRFLAKKGPGLHHVAYQVSDIDATLGALKQAGLALIDEQPRIGIRGSRVAFMHPAATVGVLTEIVEPAAGLEDH